MNLGYVNGAFAAAACLAVCGTCSDLSDRSGQINENREDEPRYPKEVEALLRSRELRDTPIPDWQFSAAMRAAMRSEGGAPFQVLAGGLTSREDNQAIGSAAAIMRWYGCDQVRGRVRDQVLRQMRTFPTGYGALLLGCLDRDGTAIMTLRSFEPVPHGLWSAEPFRDWDTARTVALAEAGDSHAKRVLIRRIDAGELELLVSLLAHNLFPYIRDRDILMALTASLLDDRLMRPGEPTDTDHLNPLISDLARSEFDSRFGLDVLGERVPPGGYTEVHKRSAYNKVRELLGFLEEGAKVPQGRRARETLRGHN